MGTEPVWQVSHEIALSTTARNKVILGHEIICLLWHLEAHGASFWCLGLHLLYLTAPLSCRHGATWIPGSPIQESPIPWAHRRCHDSCLLYPAETRAGTVAVKQAGKCPQSQEHFTQVFPMLIEILTYWHCYCTAGFSRNPSKSTTAAASFYWHGHTWVTVQSQEMKQYAGLKYNTRAISLQLGCSFVKTKNTFSSAIVSICPNGFTCWAMKDKDVLFNFSGIHFSTLIIPKDKLPSH